MTESPTAVGLIFSSHSDALAAAQCETLGFGWPRERQSSLALWLQSIAQVPAIKATAQTLVHRVKRTDGG